jgi:hypothetical protein
MLTSGDRFPVADHDTVSGSQIKTESILCDTHGFR